MSITLTKTEIAILTEAAARQGGRLILPTTVKEVTCQRLLGKLMKHELIAVFGDDHVLTPSGYRAIGLRPPRKARLTGAAEESGRSGQPTRSGTKLALILDLLEREQGATLSELIAATGWLPHTTRAALSRIRSAGRELAKEPRPDGATAYRIAGSNQPAPAAGQRRAVGRRKARQEETRPPA